jgi:isoleucyl-tRNA synthetase
MAKELKDTLNLPKTQFPMRAGLAQREPSRINYWEEKNVYHKTQRDRANAPTFILPDGPPYANGNIHMGHALNKILKDIVIRYKTMKGYRVPYVPGWDCHGLPIEQQILKQFGEKIHSMDPTELRGHCAAYARSFIDIQRTQFKRLGILADWETPYCTLNPEYEKGILECLLALTKEGLIEKGHKAVHWDPVFRTALAEAEIEYHPHVSDSIYVEFPIINAPQYPSLKAATGLEVSVVIWTTTPWTLPANLGVSLHPEFEYVLLQHEKKAYIIAQGRLESFTSECKLENTTVLASFKATEFENGLCVHPIFPEKTSRILLGDHVTLEQGTGCVHTAPGHGADDFIIGKRYGLPVLVPVDDKGCYTADYPEMEGTFVFDANPAILEKLKAKGILIASHKIKHDYPFSWRSKKPILFRATEQWFFRLDEEKVRNKALKAIDESVTWIPSWGRDRIRNMVERRAEWCISRQRAWGVPIPAVRSKKNGDSILAPEIIEAFIKVVAERGTDVWYSEPLESWFPSNFVYGPTGESQASDFEKESDILDVWFDSGASHIASLEADPRLQSPADLYLEGSDQHRGWFQAALLTSIGARQRAPFKAVLTHGFVLDGQGRAMSKSMGNVISPLDLIEKYGADVIRLWVNSLDYSSDVGISNEILENIARAYRDVRNTFRYLLGTISDFNPQTDSVAVDDLFALDRWALNELANLVDKVSEAYEKYEFHRAFILTTQFCTVTLSSQYHDILKDRLYTYGANSRGRRSAQTVLQLIFDTLTRLMAPVLAFTCDEARSYAQNDSDFADETVYAAEWPTVPAQWRAPELSESFTHLLSVRAKVNEQLEGLRQNKVIGKSIDASVCIRVPISSPEATALLTHAVDLPELFIVSEVIVETIENLPSIEIIAKHATGVRCPRSLRWVPELITTEFGSVSPRCAEALKSLSNL